MTMTTDREARELFANLPTLDEEAGFRLHARLIAAADRDGILDVAYRTIDTPVGTLLLAATEQGLLRVAYAREDHDAVLVRLAEVVSPRILTAPARLDRSRGRSRSTSPVGAHVSTCRWTSGCRRASAATCSAHLPEIGYGRTGSYAEVAAAAGSPKAVRAVGTACATNPLPVVVPCHRVVRSRRLVRSLRRRPRGQADAADLGGGRMTRDRDATGSPTGWPAPTGRRSTEEVERLRLRAAAAAAHPGRGRRDRGAVRRAGAVPGHDRHGPVPVRRGRVPLLRRTVPRRRSSELRQALYPRLLPIARDWYAKLGRDAEWPDTLDEWLDICHRAGQTRPTPILLRYGAGDWNALHRDLYGDKVFPLQVVINLERAGRRPHRRRVPAASSNGHGPSRAAPRR